MKKTKLIVTLIIIISIISVGIYSYAGVRGKGKHPFGFGKGQEPEAHKQLTEEELAAKKAELTEALKAKLEAGEITQEEYDKKLQQIEEGKGFNKGKPQGRMNPPQLPEEEKAAKKAELTEALKAKLEAGEITQEEYDKKLQQIEEGKGFNKGKPQGRMNPPQLTEEEKADMKEKMLSDLKAKLDSGEITEEKYNEAVTKIEEGKNLPRGIMQGKGPMGKGFQKRKPDNQSGNKE